MISDDMLSAEKQQFSCRNINTVKYRRSLIRRLWVAVRKSTLWEKDVDILGPQQKHLFMKVLCSKRKARESRS
jgi:hypothetical protein